MPRHSRIKSKTNIYHVMSRGLNKQLLFDDETDYLRYLQLLNDIKKEYGIKVYAYCLMSNHVHIILKDDNEMISTAMRRLNSRYAMYYNRKNCKVGYVFSDRFKSEAIETKEYLLTCIRYVHQNPVKADICNKTYNYKFSSIHAYRRDKGNLFGIVDKPLNMIKMNKNEFLKWNETSNDDRCMEVANKKLSDKEVIAELLKLTNVKKMNEFRNLDEPTKMLTILKMIDQGISMMQLSRVTNIYYSKIQKLKKGQEGKIIGLTYYN